METNGFDNQNKGELLESLKDKCKSIVKRNLYLGLLVWILVVLCLIFGGLKLDNPKNVYYSIFFIAVAVLGGWLLLIDFRFLKKADNLDAPGLLNLFEKRLRYNFISWNVFYFIFIIGGILVVSGFDIGAYVGVAIGLVIVAILFYRTGGPVWYRKEKDIIEQLRELVEKK